MKPLPEIIHKRGFTYTQVCRGQRSCIYAQGVSGNIVCYEVFIIKITQPRHFKSKFIEAHERFPHDESFGRWAWSFSTLEEAKTKFNELESQ